MRSSHTAIREYPPLTETRESPHTAAKTQHSQYGNKSLLFFFLEKKKSKRKSMQHLTLGFKGNSVRMSDDWPMMLELRGRFVVEVDRTLVECY